MKSYPTYEGLENVVFDIGYLCVGTDEEYSAQVYGNTKIELSTDQPFTPYENLTQEQVLTWIFDGKVNKNEVELNIQKQIVDQKILLPEMQEIPLPWVPIN